MFYTEIVIIHIKVQMALKIRLKKIIALLATIYATSMLVGCLATNCQENLRMPKIVQVEATNEEVKANIGTAIATSETLNALFTGGGVT